MPGRVSASTANTLLPPADDRGGRWASAFSTDDVDRARQHVSGLLCDHTLDHRFPDTPPLFRHSHAPFGALSVHELDYTMYGGEAVIRVPALPGVYLLEMSLEGRSVFERPESAGGDVAFRAGQICMANAGERHAKRWLGDGRQIIVPIPQARLNRALEEITGVAPVTPLRFDPAPRDVDAWTGSLVQVVRLIFSELQRPEGGLGRLRAAESAERLLLEVLLETVPHNYARAVQAEGGEALTGLPARSSGPVPAAVRRAMAFMRADPARPVTLEDVAAAAGAPVRTLQRAFRDATGEPPMTWLRNLRLDTARQLLLAGAETRVTDAALAAGFGHLGKFAAAYRLRFGESPSETLAGR